MRELTILFMPESAYGPTNNGIGIGDLLRRRGHRVVFAAEASWRGKLAPRGFTEDLVDLAAPAGDGAVDPGQFWKDFVRDTAPEFRKPTIEQLETWIKPVWEELTSGARYCQQQLVGIIDRVRPDVIVEDNVVDFPALRTAGVLGVSRRRPQRLGELPRRVRKRPPPAVGRVRRVGPRAGRARAPGPGVHRRRRPEPVRLPRDRRLSPGP